MKPLIFLALLTLVSASGDKHFFLDLPEYSFSDYTQSDTETTDDQGGRVNTTDILEAGFNATTNRSSTDQPLMSEAPADNQVLNCSAEDPNTDNFKNDGIKPNQNQRRDVTLRWTDDSFAFNSAPTSLDLNPPIIRVDGNDIPKSSGYLESRNQDRPAFVIAQDHSDRNGLVKPQYIQNIYYYNYYPLVKEREQEKWGENINPGERVQKPQVPAKRRSRNPCKTYFEFFKYALNKLEEGGENYDDYDHSHGFPNYVNHQHYGTKLAGPTLYIDNSGKIYQVSTNGNGVQVAEGIAPESRVSVSTNTTKSPLEQGRPTIAITPETSTLRILTTTPIFTTQGGTQYHHPWYPREDSILRSGPQAPTTKIKEKTSATASREMDEPTTSENKIVETTRLTDEQFERTEGPPKTKPDDDTDDLTTVRHLPFAFTGSHPGFSFSFTHSRFPALAHTVTPPSPPSSFNRINAETVLSVKDNDGDDKEDCTDKMLPCPDTVNITYPLNGYCNRYVSCESGKAIRRTCPKGLHFNLIIKSCDLPHNSFCTYACPVPNGLFGIPGDCNGYFVCKNFELEYRMCPPRMHWDQVRRICTFSEFSTCPMKCKQEYEVRHYEGDCKAYIVCMNGIPYYHRCPPNMTFNRNDLLCEPSTMSNCIDDPRLLTKTLNQNALCKDVMLKMTDTTWCRSYLRSKNSTGA